MSNGSNKPPEDQPEDQPEDHSAEKDQPEKPSAGVPPEGIDGGPPEIDLTDDIFSEPVTDPPAPENPVRLPPEEKTAPEDQVIEYADMPTPFEANEGRKDRSIDQRGDRARNKRHPVLRMVDRLDVASEANLDSADFYSPYYVREEIDKQTERQLKVPPTKLMCGAMTKGCHRCKRKYKKPLEDDLRRCPVCDYDRRCDRVIDSNYRCTAHIGRGGRNTAGEDRRKLLSRYKNAYPPRCLSGVARDVYLRGLTDPTLLHHTPEVLLLKGMLEEALASLVDRDSTAWKLELVKAQEKADKISAKLADSKKQIAKAQKDVDSATERNLNSRMNKLEKLRESSSKLAGGFTDAYQAVREMIRKGAEIAEVKLEARSLIDQLAEMKDRENRRIREEGKVIAMADMIHMIGQIMSIVDQEVIDLKAKDAIAARVDWVFTAGQFIDTPEYTAQAIIDASVNE